MRTTTNEQPQNTNVETKAAPPPGKREPRRLRTALRAGHHGLGGMAGAQSNPLYQPSGGSGVNPLFGP